MKILRWASFALLVCISVPALAAGQPNFNKGKWRNVNLPFRPFAITAVDGALWICGVNETVAVSRDQGSTWQIVHQQADGEILLNIAFLDKDTAHAAGTGGLVLSTTDGGKSWSAHRGGPTVQTFAFSSGSDGIAEIDGHVDLTSDGGTTWQPVTVMETDTRIKPFAQVESVAALNSSHLAVALHQDQGENIMLSTTDGGKTWVPTHIANTFAGTLITRDGEYWAFGIEYLGRENNPGGGYSAAVTLRSSDGQRWTHGVRASTEFDGCTPQACYLRYGVLEDLYGKDEKIWSLPQDAAMSAQWAMVADTVCNVDGFLKCGKAIPSPAAQPMPESGSEYLSFDRPVTFTEGCLDCRLARVPAPGSLGGRGAMIQGAHAKFTIRRNGTVTQVHVTGAPSNDLKESMERQITTWLITPGHHGSATIETERSVALNLLCFPRFPGQTGPQSCNVVPAASMTIKPHP
jgi:hypothetical protein